MLGLLNGLKYISVKYNCYKSNYGNTVLPLKEIKLLQLSKLFYSVSDDCNITFVLTLEEKRARII